MTESLRVLEVISQSGLEEAQKALLPPIGKRGTEKQKDFISKAAESPIDFYKEILKWGVDSGEPPPVLSAKLTEKQYIDPPWNTEVMIADTWSDLTPNLASRPGTWTRIHVELLRAGIIHSNYLANNPSSESGETRIRAALRRNSSKEIDDCVRSILRRLGGIPSVRAARTSFIDCPLAKAWWRHQFAKEVYREVKNSTLEEFSNVSLEEFSEVMRPSAFWENFIESMVSRLTVVGTYQIRVAMVLLLYLLKFRKHNKEDIRNLFRAVGQRSTTQLLGALESAYVFEIFRDETYQMVTNSRIVQK